MLDCGVIQYFTLITESDTIDSECLLVTDYYNAPALIKTVTLSSFFSSLFSFLSSFSTWPLHDSVGKPNWSNNSQSHSQKFLKHVKKQTTNGQRERGKRTKNMKWLRRYWWERRECERWEREGENERPEWRLCRSQDVCTSTAFLLYVFEYAASISSAGREKQWQMVNTWNKASG